MKTSKLVKSYLIYWLFVLVSLISVFIITKFSINDFVSNPQFANFDHFYECLEFISNTKGKTGWFKWYFYIDFIWPLLFLASMFQIIYKINCKTYKTSVRLFLILGFLGYVFDVIENTIYLTSLAKATSIANLSSPEQTQMVLKFQETASTLQIIAKIKEAAFAIAVIIFIYTIYKRYIKRRTEKYFYF